MKRLAVLLVAMGWSLLVWAGDLTAVELRIAAYNTFNTPDNPTQDAWYRTTLAAIENQPVHGNAKRVDALALAETDAESSARLVDLLNQLYGVTTYRCVTSSNAGDRTGIRSATTSGPLRST